MAGLGMAILGGALEQVGTGIADRGKALREEKLKQLSQEREFQFRSREAGLGDERQAAENQKSRDAQAAENEKTRQNQRDIASIKTDNTSTNVADANWLVKTGIEPDVKSAYARVKAATTDRSEHDRIAVDIYKTLSSGGGPLPGNGTPSDADYWQEAQKRVDAMTGGGAKSDPYTNDRTAPEGPSNVIKSKPGALRAPPGDGTQDRPFKAAKQADLDWFKQYAKPGDMIEYGGTIYTK